MSTQKNENRYPSLLENTSILIFNKIDNYFIAQDEKQKNLQFKDKDGYSDKFYYNGKNDDYFDVAEALAGAAGRKIKDTVPAGEEITFLLE